MRPRKGEIGLRIMVKYPERPRRGIMALPAVNAERAAMGVILLVTGETVAWRRFIFLGQMAFSARDRLVFPKKREGIQVVVKFHLFLPRSFVVAVDAYFSLRTLMRIIGFVAVDAARSRKGFRNRFDMTRLASSFGMRAAKRKFCLRVIESDSFPVDFRMT